MAPLHRASWPFSNGCRGRQETARAAARHSGIGLHTPASIHYGTANAVRAERARVLEVMGARSNLGRLPRLQRDRLGRPAIRPWASRRPGNPTGGGTAPRCAGSDGSLKSSLSRYGAGHVPI